MREPSVSHSEIDGLKAEDGEGKRGESLNSFRLIRQELTVHEEKEK